MFDQERLPTLEVQQTCMGDSLYLQHSLNMWQIIIPHLPKSKRSWS